jgi:CheY-like chemotaxis protein
MAKRILIVDDEEDVRTFLNAVLEKAGYETVIACDGVEARNAVNAQKPDLITLDLQMPKNSGTDFYRGIRRDPDLKSIPVIVVSGLPGRHLAVPEPFAVFDKPIDPDELLAKVQEAIG